MVTGAGVFTWAEDMYERLEENTKTPINTWEYYYARIMGCNVVLDNIDAAIGDVSKKGNVKGQALTMRAYYHLCWSICLHDLIIWKVLTFPKNLGFR